MQLDHIAVAAETLAAGVAAVESALGVALPEAVGRHAEMGTMNRLLSLGGHEYLEVIAIDPEADDPGRPRWFGLDAFSGPPRIVSWVCSVADLDRERLPDAGELLRFARGRYRWRMAVPADGKLPFSGLQPAQIQWQSPHPAGFLPPSGCRLHRLMLVSPQADAVAARLAGLDDRRVIVASGPAPHIRVELATSNGLRGFG